MNYMMSPRCEHPGCNKRRPTWDRFCKTHRGEKDPVPSMETIKTLDAATVTQRAEYVARYEQSQFESLVHMRKVLADAGMDLTKVAPRPSSNMGRTAYMIAQHTRGWYTKYFKLAKNDTHCYRPVADKAPEIVVEKPDAEANLRAEARSQANSYFTSFLTKLAGKIVKIVKTARLTGVLWSGCVLTVECEDGEVQVWETKCILNFSIYRKAFNQWPTRRVS